MGYKIHTLNILPPHSGGFYSEGHPALRDGNLNNVYINFTDDFPSLLNLAYRFPNCSTTCGKRVITINTLNNNTIIEIIDRNKTTIISVLDLCCVSPHIKDAVYLDYKLQYCTIYINGRIYYMYNYNNNNLHGTIMITLHGYKYIIHMNNGKYLRSYKCNRDIYNNNLIAIDISDALICTLQNIDREIRNLLC